VNSLYLDNAATSWPKPPGVPRAMSGAVRHGGGNPGRSGHAKSIQAGRTVLRTRELLAELFHVPDPSRIVFTKNATEALNIVLFGLLRPGDRVLTTSMEHNSVLRPLTALARKGVVVDFVEAGTDGLVSSGEVAARLGGGVRLAVVTHASNVTGTVNDIAAISAVCRERGVMLLVDAAQSAGCIPIDLARLPVDYLAFSGHKGLLGPQGTGGLFVRQESDLPPFTRGGTGSLSDREDQPEFLPDRFESGTLNVPGIAGLGEGVSWLLKWGVESVAAHDRRLRDTFLAALDADPRVTVFGGQESVPHTGVISVRIGGVSPSEAGESLERQFGILTRIGLHCAPRAHRTIGTFPDGTVRLGWGPYTRERDMVRAARAILAIARSTSPC
jgi:cysteine desulfurase / selenocysteine lyase